MYIKNGFISINDKEYTYRLFDVNEIKKLMQEEPEFIKSLETTIKIYRNNPSFVITDLIIENTTYRPDDNKVLFIISDHNTIISTCRFYFNGAKKTGYFNLIYTNPEYRGQKICQNNIKFILDATKRLINTFELEVDITNLAAIKCYENNGFKIIKEEDQSYLMRLNN
jgi:RimJ/RimL family protein N-acetyltransferase